MMNWSLFVCGVGVGYFVRSVIAQIELRKIARLVQDVADAAEMPEDYKGGERG